MSPGLGVRRVALAVALLLLLAQAWTSLTNAPQRLHTVIRHAAPGDSAAGLEAAAAFLTIIVPRTATPPLDGPAGWCALLHDHRSAGVVYLGILDAEC